MSAKATLWWAACSCDASDASRHAYICRVRTRGVVHSAPASLPTQSSECVCFAPMSASCDGLVDWLQRLYHRVYADLARAMCTCLSVCISHQRHLTAACTPQQHALPPMKLFSVHNHAIAVEKQSHLVLWVTCTYGVEHRCPFAAARPQARLRFIRKPASQRMTSLPAAANTERRVIAVVCLLDMEAPA